VQEPEQVDICPDTATIEERIFCPVFQVNIFKYQRKVAGALLQNFLNEILFVISNVLT